MAEPMVLPDLLPHAVKSYTYATRNGTPVELDVYLPEKTPSGPVPALLYFHGGFVITGSRHSAPIWLVNAYLRRGWILVSADFRSLPESTGLDILADIEAAWSWIANDLAREAGVEPDCSRLALAGSSGGGWCALVGATTLSNPKPKVAWAFYPMAESAAEVRLKPEPLRLMSDAELDALLKEIDERVEKGQVSTGQRIKMDFSDVMTHPRAVYVMAMKQSGRYVDHLTGVKKMGERITAKGVVEALKGEREELKKLFPLECGGLSKDTPPLLLMHGTADQVVDEGESIRFVQKAREMGTSVDYWSIEDGAHGFEWVNRDVDDDQAKRTYAELESGKALQKFLEYLER